MRFASVNWLQINLTLVEYNKNQSNFNLPIMELNFAALAVLFSVPHLFKPSI